MPARSTAGAESVIPYIIDSDFKTALNSIDSMIRIDSEDPFPYILKLTALGMRDIDFDRTIDSAAFLSTYQKAIDCSNKLESTSGKTSYSRMMVGLCKVMHASFYLRNKAYFAAMQNGFDALDILDEARKIDSSNTEVLMFLGMYDFARAELKSRLWWVLFWYPGNVDAGIEKLKRCSQESTLMRTAAKISLSEIYIKENKLKAADSLLNALEKQHSHSRFVQWSRAKYFETQKNFSKAAKIYEMLAHSYLNTAEGLYNSFITRYKAAEMFRNAGEITSAKSVCQNLLSEPDLAKYKEVFRDTQRLWERVQKQ